MSDRSLLTRAFDGFWAPRWVHHLVKLATGAAVLGVFALLASSPAAAALCSLLWFMSLRVAYSINHGTPLIKPDLGTDLALHATPLAGLIGNHLVACLVAVLLVLVYLRTYPDASP